MAAAGGSAVGQPRMEQTLGLREPAAWTPLEASAGPPHLCHQRVYPPWICLIALSSPFFPLQHPPGPDSRTAPREPCPGFGLRSPCNCCPRARGAIPPTTGRIHAPPPHASSLWGAHPAGSSSRGAPTALRATLGCGDAKGPAPGRGTEPIRPASGARQPRAGGPARGSRGAPSSGFPQCLSHEGAALPHSAWPEHPGSARGHIVCPCPGPSRTCTRP